MRNIILKLMVVIIGSFISTTTSIAQVQIEVLDLSSDMTGQRLIYFIKEGFRKSSTFELNDGFGPRWKIIVSTMPKEEFNPSIATIYSAVWIMIISGGACNLDETPIYLYSTIGYCGRDVVESTAQSIIAQTDQLVSKLRKALINSAP